MENFTVKIVSLADIFDLRYRILRDGKPKTEAIFEGDYEVFTLHFALYKEEGGVAVGEPLSCATFIFHPVHIARGDAYRLRGMATDTQWQGKGLGKMLLDYAEDYIVKNMGVKRFWCTARSGDAVKFYHDKVGWRAISDEFEIKGVGPHHYMMKDVART